MTNIAELPDDMTAQIEQGMLTAEQAVELSQPSGDEAEALQGLIAKAEQQTNVDDAESAPAPAEPAANILDPAPAPAFVYQAPSVEGFEEKLTEIEDQKANAFEKSLNGEITAAEYSAIEKAANREMLRLHAAQMQAETAAAMAAQSTAAKYNAEIYSLAVAAKSAGADYFTNQEMRATLDATMRSVQENPLTASLPLAQQFERAHLITAGIHGLQLNTQPAAKSASRAPDLSGLPPNISKAPPAAMTDTGDEFGHLDRLNEDDRVAAIDKMSDAARNRYLRGG